MTTHRGIPGNRRLPRAGPCGSSLGWPVGIALVLPLLCSTSELLCRLRAGVKRLQRLGMVTDVPGMSALDMNTAEDAVVANTREVVPGMVICGMEARSPLIGAPAGPAHLRLPAQRMSMWAMA